MSLTLWGHAFSLFRINLPIQTFSALNFRGECVLVGRGGTARARESAWVAQAF